MTPCDFANAAERRAQLPSGPGDVFDGYGVIGLPFDSGHVLALRRFCDSSVGSAYTSVWHRDPAGRWTFYSTVVPDCSCARYFGAQVTRNVLTPIALEWTTPWTLRVAAGVGLTWQIGLRSSPTTRLLNRFFPLIPSGAWQVPTVLRTMGVAASALLDAGRLSLTGQTPNGHRFVMRPRRLWLVDASSARVAGRDVGPMGALGQQATLEDMAIPQRGLFAIASARMERQEHRTQMAAWPSEPCPGPRRAEPLGTGEYGGQR